jgi:hypothetical protein
MSDESENEINSSPMYKDRNDWKDITPVYNSADEDAVVKIAHSDNCKLVTLNLNHGIFFSHRRLRVLPRHLAQE